jgi:hypothetical protein
MLLQDDKKRMGYTDGEKVVDPMKEAINNIMGLGVSKEEVNIIQNNTMSSPEVRKIINRVEKETSAEPGNVFTLFNAVVKKEEPRVQKAMGKLVGNQKEIDANKDGEITGEDFKLLQKAEGGSMDDQMLMVMTPPMESEMEPDGEMEDNYTRFIMEEALSEEEEDMLTSKLEQDEELSMLFDKIIDVAQEFAGSGPVEGPGSGVSDSIPARLSDGEFVFTAKAVEEIGEDSLMSMMKEAEAAADERQGLAEGGILEPEKEPERQMSQTGIPQDDPSVDEALTERVISGDKRYIQS